MITTFHWKNFAEEKPDIEDEKMYVCAFEEDMTLTIDTVWIVDKDPLLYDLYKNAMSEYTRANNAWWTHWMYHKEFEEKNEQQTD